jgi:benzoyl-CoA-dihydrodiol lyase
VPLAPLDPKIGPDSLEYGLARATIDRRGRTATIVLRGPSEPPPADAVALRQAGCKVWMLRLFREFDDLLCRLRFNEEEIGLLILKTEGETDRVLAHDAALARLAESDWFAREILLLAARVLRRLDGTARSLFALVEAGSCCAGALLETALSADRTYALDDPALPVTLALSPLNFGALPMGHGPARLQTRMAHDPAGYAALAARARGGDALRFEARAAAGNGLVTVAADEIDYADEVRVAIEERTSLSPDALTGMEASLRFPGAESTETKIFGRLSAWQNWIFQRPNATGDQGALRCYGRPERPSFDWRRT